jgi:hypothetical protein
MGEWRHSTTIHDPTTRWRGLASSSYRYAPEENDSRYLLDRRLGVGTDAMALHKIKPRSSKPTCYTYWAILTPFQMGMSVLRNKSGKLLYD